MRIPVRQIVLNGLDKLQKRLDPEYKHISVERLRKLSDSCNEYIKNHVKKTDIRVLWPTVFNIDKLWWAHDGVLANALRIRGADILPTTCGRIQEDECMILGGVWQDALGANSKEKRNKFCEQCVKNDYQLWDILGIKPVNLSSFLSQHEISEIWSDVDIIMKGDWENYEFDGFKVGKSVIDAVINNEMQDRIRKDWYEEAKIKARSHLFNILALMKSYDRVFHLFSPNRIFGNGGFYYQWGVVDHIAQKNNIPYYRYYWEGCHPPLSWNYNLNTNSIIDFSAAWDSWILNEWNAEKEDRINADLKKRGFYLNINENTSFETKKQNIVSELNLDLSKPILLLLGGVIYDANSNAPGKCYQDMYEWMLDTLKWAASRPDVQLVIRTHPAEDYVNEIGKTKRTRFIEELKRLNIQVPSNIRIIPPSSKIASYDLMHIANVGLSYASTSGLEFSCLGKPCFAMGPAHYAKKGFTVEPNNREEYYNLLEKYSAANVIDTNSKELARKYWYFYAFHAAFNTGLLVTKQVPSRLQKQCLTTIVAHLDDVSVEDLLPGKNAQLDYICDAILQNKPIYGNNIWPPELKAENEF